LLRDWPHDCVLFFADENGGENFVELLRRQEPQPGTSQNSTEGPCLRRNSMKAALLVGPEGGFDDAERASIRALPQARAVSLGPRVLRGETAAIAAMAVWMAVVGDWHK